MKLCHGYLGSQLLRPYNDRKWKYGGSWENRSRFAFELFERIVKEINDPDFLIGSKVSAWEGFPGGCGSMSPTSAVIDLTESIALVKGLEERGAHYILQSAGSPSITLALSQPDQLIPDDAYLHHWFSKTYRDNLKPETVVIGSAYSIFGDGRNKLQAVKKEENTVWYWGDKNIREGVTDMIAFGRQSLADPSCPRKLMAGKPETRQLVHRLRQLHRVAHSSAERRLRFLQHALRQGTGQDPGARRFARSEADLVQGTIH